MMRNLSEKPRCMCGLLTLWMFFIDRSNKHTYTTFRFNRFLMQTHKIQFPIRNTMDVQFAQALFGSISINDHGLCCFPIYSAVLLLHILAINIKRNARNMHGLYFVSYSECISSVCVCVCYVWVASDVAQFALCFIHRTHVSAKCRLLFALTSLACDAHHQRSTFFWFVWTEIPRPDRNRVLLSRTNMNIALELFAKITSAVQFNAVKRLCALVQVLYVY